jgi:hypothetical protein
MFHTNLPHAFLALILPYLCGDTINRRKSGFAVELRLSIWAIVTVVSISTVVVFSSGELAVIRHLVLHPRPIAFGNCACEKVPNPHSWNLVIIVSLLSGS